ncbi:protein kinase [Rhodobacterales bacterium HKCCE2091]|nr:protein kinase [Rhodobacterales bacterium HKCCE2091]
MKSDIIFDKPKKYKLIRQLGEGACGRTVLVRDEEMDCELVSKKYVPMDGIEAGTDFFKELLERFRQEARILFRLHHPNIVRVYNYFDYSDLGTGYIMMEFVDGTSVIDYLAREPLKTGSVFQSLIGAFAYLEERDILHRDIRSQNIMVTADGTVKIIDFGFGKTITSEIDARRSVSLNWWCEPPAEIAAGLYDHRTEQYFVGKLFEEVIREHELSDFPYLPIVSRMTQPDAINRFQSFSEILAATAQREFSEISFSSVEKQAYTDFAEDLVGVFSSINSDATYRVDVEELIKKLGELYDASMLEDTLPNPVVLARIFVRGSFRYYNNAEVRVSGLLAFIKLIKAASPLRQEIIAKNLAAKLDAIPRKANVLDIDDEIPF